MKKIAKKIAATAIAAAVIATASCSNTTDSSENNKTQTPGSPVITDTDGDGVPDSMTENKIYVDKYKNEDTFKDGEYSINLGMWAYFKSEEDYRKFRKLEISFTLPDGVEEIHDFSNSEIPLQSPIELSGWFSTSHEKHFVGTSLWLLPEEKNKDAEITFTIKAIGKDNEVLASQDFTAKMNDDYQTTFTGEAYGYIIGSSDWSESWVKHNDDEGCPCHEESEEVCGCEDYCIYKFSELDQEYPECLCDNCQHTK